MMTVWSKTFVVTYCHIWQSSTYLWFQSWFTPCNSRVKLWYQHLCDRILHCDWSHTV